MQVRSRSLSDSGEAQPMAKAPLTFAKGSLKEAAIDLTLEITADPKDPTTGKLSIRWGRHEASAPVKFQLAAPKEPAGAKK